jgi:hypothetical protein
MQMMSNTLPKDKLPLTQVLHRAVERVATAKSGVMPTPLRIVTEPQRILLTA